MSKLAVILAGGGARGAYQIGVLKYLAENFPNDFKPEIWCGTSAGAINTAFMVQFADDLKRGVSNLEQIWTNLRVEDVYRINLLQVASMGFRWLFDLFFGGIRYIPRYRSLFDTSPLFDLLKHAIDIPRVHRMVQEGVVDAMTITCTEYGTGRAVVFVQSRNEKAHWQRHQRTSRQTVIGLEHIMASSALPLIFPAIKIHGVYYGDGSMRDNHPLSPAAKLGAEKVLAIGVRGKKPEFTEPARRYPRMATIGGALMNSVFLDALESDYENVDRINRLIKNTPLLHYRPIDIHFHMPSRDIGTKSVAHFSELPGFVKHLLLGFKGRTDESSSDFLSYLLFSGGYAKDLIELGYQDAKRDHHELKKFLTTPSGSDESGS